MASRVTVNITVRDLTQGELRRIRQGFGRLGQDLDRAVGQRSRANFQRLSQSVNNARRQLDAMRGAIPDDEFFRMDDAIRRSQRTLQRGFSNVGDAAFGRVSTQLRGLIDDFDRLNQSGQIRIRVDDSALRRADARLAAGLRNRNQTVRVRVDPDADGFGARLRRVLLAPLRQTGRIAGGILSDGIGQGIVAGFQSAGPIGIAIFAGLLATVVSLIGSALGGILVFAFGAAVVGIAGIMASKSEEVKNAWSDTIESIKKDFEGAGKPMEEVLIKGMKLLEEMSAQFAPHFKQAVEDAAPHLLIFQQKLAHGIEKFGEIAFKPLMDGFNELLDSLGPEMETFFTHLGEAFAYLGEQVKEHSDEVALAIRLVLEIITGLVYVLGWLIEQWARFLATLALAEVAFQTLRDWFDQNWDLTVQLFGLASILACTLAVQNLWGWVNRNWSRVVQFLSPGLSSLIGAVGTLWNWVNRNWARVVRFTAPGLQSAINAVSTLWGWVNRNWYRVVTLSISIPGLSAAKDALSGLGFSPFAHGGVRGMSAAATGGVRSNMTLVGEQGPELVNLAPGSHVRSNADSRRLASNGGSGGTPALIFKSSGRRVDDLLLEILREAIHQRGGDPIAVLGG